MRYLGYIGFLAGMLWGAMFILGAANSSTSELIGEGQYVLLVITFPLFLIGLIHTGIDGRFPSLPLIYASGIALLFIGQLIAYKTVFLDRGPQLRTSFAATITAFVLAMLAFSIIPLIRRLKMKTAEQAPSEVPSKAGA